MMGDTKLNYTEYQEFFFRHAKFKKPTKYTEILRMKYVYPEIRGGLRAGDKELVYRKIMICKDLVVDILSRETVSIIKKEGEKDRKEGKKEKRKRSEKYMDASILDVWQNRIIFPKDHEVYDAKKPKRVKMGSILIA